MKKEKDSGMLIQGSILAAAGLITKIIGVIYKIPLTNLLNEVGWGKFMNAFRVYSIALTFSYNSMPMAVSKLVSESIASGNQKKTRKVFTHSVVFGLGLGAAASLILFFGAEFFEKILQTSGIAPAVRVLSVTVFLVTILGLLRGYFQGYGNMIPTSVSQIIEQIVNAVTAITVVSYLSRIYTDPDMFIQKSVTGACFGTLAGAAAAVIFLEAAYIKSAAGRRKSEMKSSDTALKTSLIYRSIILTIVPMIISQTVYQIGGFFDDIIFKYNLVTVKGYIEDDATALQGFYTGQYNQLINLPISVATALAVTLLPAISFESSRGDIEKRDEKILSVMKLTSLIAFPGAVGIGVMARPLISLLFPGISGTEWKLALAAGLLQCGFLSVIAYSFSTVTTSVLQGSGFMRKPVYNSAVSLGIHVVLVYLLTRFTTLDAYALVIADVIFPLIIMFMNIHSMNKDMKYKLNAGDVFLKPAVCSAIMGAACSLVYVLLNKLAGVNIIISFTLSVCAAAAVYFALILKTKYFSRDELTELPMGRTIVSKFNISE